MILFTAAVFLVILIGRKKYHPIGYLRNHPVLFLCSVGLSAFASTNTLSCGTWRFQLFQMPDRIMEWCNIFRSSSRLFWPVYYLIFLFVAIFVVQHAGDFIKSRSAGVILLCILVVLQFADMGPTLAYKHVDFVAGSPHYDNPVDCDFFSENRQTFQRIITIGDTGVMRGLYLGLYGAKNGIEISDPFAARWDQQAQNETSEMWYQQLLDGDMDTVAQETLQDTAVCAYINNTYYVVFSKESKTIWSPDQADVSFEFP